MERHFLEHFLRVNGLDQNASREDVCVLFQDAGWPNKEIERACKVLDGEEIESRDGHQHWRIGLTPSSKNISELLGVKVEVDPTALSSDTRRSPELRLALSLVSVVLLSILIAALLAVGIMYVMDLGPFRVSSSIFS